MKTIWLNVKIVPNEKIMMNFVIDLQFAKFFYDDKVDLQLHLCRKYSILFFPDRVHILVTLMSYLMK